MVLAKTRAHRAAGSWKCIYVIACDKREAFAQGSAATKQSIFVHGVAMDCFAEPVIGRAFARPVGSQ
jgi:hypothetical protein